MMNVETTDGFNIYNSLRCLGGKPYTAIHKVLMTYDLNMPINDLRRSLTKATKAGFMKKTKRGYRLEIRLCDKVIKSIFQELQKEEFPPNDVLSLEKWEICGLGSVCHKHDVNEVQVGRLRRGASLLSVLGGTLVRNLSFLTLKRATANSQSPDTETNETNTEKAVLKRPVDEQNENQDTDELPPSKKACKDQEEQEQGVNYVLEDCWEEMTKFFRRLEETGILKTDLDHLEN